MGIKNMFSENDITNSLSRLQSAFFGRYGDFPIWEDTRKVGMLTLDKENKKIFVTYRGSVNSLFEIVSCLFIWKKPCHEIQGNAHAGLYHAFQKISPSFQKTIEKISSLDQYSFVVEGYSRGSGLAAFTALWLKDQYPHLPVNVFTYSTMQVFDQKGADHYNSLMQGHHWSFLCLEDFVPKWLGPSFLGFHPIGEKITFHADESLEYTKRVNEKRYSYLAPIPVISWIIKRLISSSLWEAHMPTIYNELSPLYHAKTSSKKFCTEIQARSAATGL
jgi:hypothetical protein